VFLVRALGDDVLAACASLATLGGVAPAPALEAIEPTLPQRLGPALQEGVVRRVVLGGVEVFEFTDLRMVASLAATQGTSHALGIRLAVGAWALRALEQLEPSDFSRMASVYVPLATPALEGPQGSYWEEAFAATRGGRAETVTRLEAAARGAHGVRRLVLLRRIAELKLFLGLPDEALAIIASAGRPVSSTVQALPPGALGKVLDAQHGPVLDRWSSLTADEALVALELVRAECVSFQVKKEDTQKAFAELEKRLGRLQGRATSHLWIRWAKGWSWFLCEVVGRADEAMRVCGVVRGKVFQTAGTAEGRTEGAGQHASSSSTIPVLELIALVRAEEVATASSGDFSRARALADEHLALAERAGNLREACLAWNARAIVHYGQAELLQAKRGFERAIELARGTGWLRREAVSVHNLALVLVELDELDAAFAAESTYARLSGLIGNHAAKAEAPVVLASVELARGRSKEAEGYAQQARKTAESNGWEMLVTCSRALLGRLRLFRYKTTGDVLEITKAKADLLAALEVIDERALGWTEELDPGEVVANYALALKWSGAASAALALISTTLNKLPQENVVSRQQLLVARHIVAGESCEPVLRWFEERGFMRRAALWRLFASK
jgi:tetratricopeptide (TPR) repeat protein